MKPTNQLAQPIPNVRIVGLAVADAAVIAVDVVTVAAVITGVDVVAIAADADAVKPQVRNEKGTELTPCLSFFAVGVRPLSYQTRQAFIRTIG